MQIPVYKSAPLDWQLANEIWERYANPTQLANFGPIVKRLEENVAENLNVSPEKVVSFSSATDALAACLATLGKHNNKLVIPDYSFIASLRAAQLGFDGQIEVDDVCLTDWSLRKSSDGSEVFMPVCVFGASPHYLMSKFSGHQAVIDGAASLGSLPDLSALEEEHAVCFSLHATKVFGAGEGGIAVFGNGRWAAKARGWSNFGISTQGNLNKTGANSKMSEAQGAFHLSRLEVAESEIRDWNKAMTIAAKISAELGIELSPFAFENPSPYWIAKFDNLRMRDRVERHLIALGVETRKWWPLSLSLGIGGSEKLHSKVLRETTLGLPFFREIKELELKHIGISLKKAIQLAGDEN